MVFEIYQLLNLEIGLFILRTCFLLNKNKESFIGMISFQGFLDLLDLHYIWDLHDSIYMTCILASCILASSVFSIYMTFILAYLHDLYCMTYTTFITVWLGELELNCILRLAAKMWVWVTDRPTLWKARLPFKRRAQCVHYNI